MPIGFMYWKKERWWKRGRMNYCYKKKGFTLLCGASRLAKGKNKQYLNNFKPVSMSAIQILGLIAGTITSITFLPQVIRLWKTKSVKDISMLMMLLLILGTSLWLTYGLLLKDIAIIYTNVMVLVMSLIMFYFKIRYK